MSIYATMNEWSMLIDGEQRTIFFQGVPSWVDFEASWLPPPIPDDDTPDGRVAMRVIVVISAGTEKGGAGFDGQQYHRELARLTHAEYDAAMETRRSRDALRSRLRRALLAGEATSSTPRASSRSEASDANP